MAYVDEQMASYERQLEESAKNEARQGLEDLSSRGMLGGAEELGHLISTRAKKMGLAEERRRQLLAEQHEEEQRESDYQRMKKIAKRQQIAELGGLAMQLTPWGKVAGGLMGMMGKKKKKGSFDSKNSDMGSAISKTWDLGIPALQKYMGG